MLYFSKDTKVYLIAGGVLRHIPSISNITAESTYSADEYTRAVLGNPDLSPETTTKKINSGSVDFSFYLGNNKRDILQVIFAMLGAEVSGTATPGTANYINFPSLDIGTSDVVTQHANTGELLIVNGSSMLTLHDLVLTQVDIPLKKDLFQINVTGEFSHYTASSAGSYTTEVWEAFSPLPIKVSSSSNRNLVDSCTGNIIEGQLTYIREVQWLERHTIEDALSSDLYKSSVAIGQPLKVSGSFSFYSGSLDLSRGTEEILLISILSKPEDIRFRFPRTFYTERMDINSSAYTSTIDFRANSGEAPSIDFSYI